MNPVMSTYKQQTIWWSFFCVRKPHGIPTTFWNQPSFLDLLINQQSTPIQELQNNWWWTKNEELGLINRLDNETAGLLFFAKNQIIYNEYKLKQAQWLVQKIYYADLRGKINMQGKELVITDGIYHHYSDNARMTLDRKLGRWTINHATSIIQPLYYDKQNHCTTCRIVIYKWVRHQIRIHAASIGYHIIWDTLYAPKSIRSDYKNYNKIHLRSIGLDIT